MERLILVLPVLGCLAMGAVMWVMMRGHKQPAQGGTDASLQEEIRLLRAEIALLKHDQQTSRGDVENAADEAIEDVRDPGAKA